MKRVVVDPTTSCWNFSGARNYQGYGMIGIATGRSTNAHRVSYQLFVGPIPDSHEIHHTCENKPCVNPAHLVALTRRQHQAVTPTWPGHQTHCKNGHPLSGDNLAPNKLKMGTRQCLMCVRASAKRSYARNKESKRKYAATHREQINASQRVRYAKDPQRIIDYQREWKAKKHKKPS